MNPSFPSGEEALAQAYGAERNDGEALRHFRKALEEDPESLNALIGAARILASAEDAKLRDGAGEAVKLAARANEQTGGKDATVLDALGAAYAEAGDFARASTAAQHALDLATAQGNSTLGQLVAARMQLYREKRAYRD